ncbi:unnamed protein product, partial [Heterotrigona itama]
NFSRRSLPSWILLDEDLHDFPCSSTASMITILHIYP